MPTSRKHVQLLTQLDLDCRYVRMEAHSQKSLKIATGQLRARTVPTNLHHYERPITPGAQGPRQDFEKPPIIVRVTFKF